MEQTTRALVVLAVAALLLAPVVNGVLDETAKTADRIILNNADYDGEPPPFTPDGEPPEDLPEGDGELPDDYEGELEGEFPEGLPPCTFVYFLEAEWDEQGVTDAGDPLGGIARRTEGPETQDFVLDELEGGMVIEFNITGLVGEVTASVTHVETGEVVWSEAPSATTPSPVEQFAQLRRPAVELGEYVAALDVRQAAYEELLFRVTTVSCEEVQQ